MSEAANPTHARDIFVAALRLAPEAREAYVTEACGADDTLRQRVKDLLAAHEQAGSFLEAPAARVADMGLAVTAEQHADAPLGEGAGTVVGRYKLLERIGEGGFGVVYMAEQHQPVRRKVALKVVKPGMDSRQVLARFEAERQALAIMDHPNIAKVFDGGLTDAGRPYFVMELVKGEPITEYCDRNQLPPRQRLELFAQVCHAVQHAHQKGVIHRDIKPSNVLVAVHDTTPVVKVIDFGIAKALGQELSEKTLFTAFAQLVGTPLYMSPEQAGQSALDVDTRSDIYSLGVLLYELLTGTTPFDKERFRKAAQDEIRRIIREEEPPRPSTRLSESKDRLPSISAQRHTEPAKLARLVRGELDWIVMKALEKDRSRRYETANGFAMDVQRYLADEAVAACPPSAGYRIKKFARRNKGGLAVAALVLFFLVLLGSGAGWAWRDRTAREAEVARQQGERQAKAAGQVELIFADVDRLESEQKWPEALAAARRAEAVVAGGEVDAPTAKRVRERLKDLQFVDRLEQIRMQRATFVEGKQDDVGADREYARAFHEYGVDLETLTIEESIDRLKARPSLSMPLAATLQVWADVRNRTTNDRYRNAFSNGLIAIASGVDPDPLRDWLRSNWGKSVTADELRRKVGALDLRAHHPSTLTTFASRLGMANDRDAAIKLLRESQTIYPADFWINNYLAQRLHEQKDYEGAVRYYTAAISIRPRTSASLHNLGIALSYQKKPDEAVAAYRKAIELDPKYAPAYSDLGDALLAQKKTDEAVAACRKAIELDPKLALAYSNLGAALGAQRKPDEAVAAYRKAIELDPKYAPAYSNLGAALGQKKPDEAVVACRKAIELDPKFALAYSNLGIALLAQQKTDEAIAACRTAIELDPKSAYPYTNLGNALHAQNKLDESVAAYKKAIELDPKYADAYSNLGSALNDQKKPDEAVVACRKAIELDPKLAVAYSNLGNALHAQNELDESITAHRKAIELDPTSARYYYNLGNALYGQNKPDEAVAAYRKAIELDPKYSYAYGNLGLALLRQNKPDEAVAALRKAIELDPKLALGYYNLGLALASQKKTDEALAAFEKAIELDPKNAHANHFSGMVFGTRVLQYRDKKDAAGCLAVAVEYETLKLTDDRSMYNAACIRALCASAILEDPKTPAADAARLAREQADLAMDRLHKAVAAGFSNAAHMKQDKDLAAISKREDFKKLLADLENKKK